MFNFLRLRDRFTSITSTTKRIKHNISDQIINNISMYSISILFQYLIYQILIFINNIILKIVMKWISTSEKGRYTWSNPTMRNLKTFRSDSGCVSCQDRLYFFSDYKFSEKFCCCLGDLCWFATIRIVLYYIAFYT